MTESYATYTQMGGRPSTISYLTVIACCIAAVAMTLSAVSISKADSLTDRVDRLADSRAISAGVSSSTKMSLPAIHANVPKAAAALSLHSFCTDNTQACADYIEAMHRLSDMTTCNDVKQGALATGKVDAMFTNAANDILCSGPSIKEATAPTEPAKCDIEVNDVCVWRHGQGLSITFHSAKDARRGQGSFDMNAGWNQQQGASVTAGFHYTWGG